MAILERVTPVAAVVTAASTLLCCLPLTFAGALGMAALGAVITTLWPWLASASVLLVSLGFFQLHQRKSSCSRSRRSTVALVWAAAILVFVVLAMPQLAASLLADWLA